MFDGIKSGSRKGRRGQASVEYVLIFVGIGVLLIIFAPRASRAISQAFLKLQITLDSNAGQAGSGIKR